MKKGIFHRSELLLGKDTMNTLYSTKVILFGIGGVGSWCAESLIRSGIMHLTIVDSDRICVTNINRQLQATCKTVGEVKTDALRSRLLEINPKAEIISIQKIYSKENSHEFDLHSFDYVLDAIDSLSNKAHLIEEVSKTDAIFFSSMGAALKIDPTRIKVGSFWKVINCTLGSKLRKKVRKTSAKNYKFQCVYGDEIMENALQESACGTEQCMCPHAKSGPGDEELLNHEWCSMKAAINGSLAHITGIFGFTLAGLVVKSIYEKKQLTV